MKWPDLVRHCHVNSSAAHVILLKMVVFWDVAPCSLVDTD
jgi:hypothetical protein